MQNQRIEPLNRKLKFSDRFSAESLGSGFIDPLGSWFLTQFDQVINLAKVIICGVFVDTVRQLYSGVLDEGFLHHLETLVAKDETAKVNQQYPNAKLPLGDFAVSKMGKASGYRYKLQNNEIGLVLLVGSYYHKAENNGPHLKIECSPHFIAVHNAEILQARLDTLARAILHDFDYQGVSVHLAVDLQGWKPAIDFFDHFVTYARMIRNYLGLQTADIGDGFSDVVAKYGQKDSETITIGKPTGLQTSIYNKTKQIKHIDKVDQYQQHWKIHTLGAYDVDGPDVYRVEYRFHHSVIKEMEINGKTGFASFADIAPFLAYLWKYALLRNRLDISKNHIHPVWQMLLDDVTWSTEPPYGFVKRVPKKDLSAIGKNIELLLGNLISIQARKSVDRHKFFKLLHQLDIYYDIIEYYRVVRKIGEEDFREKCSKALIQRRMLRNAA